MDLLALTSLLLLTYRIHRAKASTARTTAESAPSMGAHCLRSLHPDRGGTDCCSGSPGQADVRGPIPLRCRPVDAADRSAWSAKSRCRRMELVCRASADCRFAMAFSFSAERRKHGDAHDNSNTNCYWVSVCSRDGGRKLFWDTEYDGDGHRISWRNLDTAARDGIRQH